MSVKELVSIPNVFQHLYPSTYPRVPKFLMTVSKLIHACPLLRWGWGGKSLYESRNGLLPRKVKIKKINLCIDDQQKPKKRREEEGIEIGPVD